MNVQQCSVVSCHNDTLACSTLRLHNYSKCLRNMNFMCLVIPAAACLFILGSFVSHFNSSVNSVMSILDNVYYSISMSTGIYQIYVKGIVLCP
jgi:hypothetical protein